jgi:hypothetical protein
MLKERKVSSRHQQDKYTYCAKIHYPTDFSLLGYSHNTEKMSPSAAVCDFTTYFQSAKPFAVYTETQLEQRLEIDAFIIDAARVNHTLASVRL